VLAFYLTFYLTFGEIARLGEIEARTPSLSKRSYEAKPKVGCAQIEGFASIYACLYKQAFLLSTFGA
jgi:hypothetical protein